MSETPGIANNEPNSGYGRLEEQIRWYDQKSVSAQAWYKNTKFIEMVCAVALPLAAVYEFNIVSVGLGAIIVLLESLQHLNQWSQNWVMYRSTCEALRHEKYAYMGRTGMYDVKNDEEAKKILVSQVETLVSTEHSKWNSRQEYETHRGNRG